MPTGGEGCRGQSPAPGRRCRRWPSPAGGPSPDRRHTARAAKVANTQHFTSRAAGTRVGLHAARRKVHVCCGGSFTAPCGKGRDNDNHRRGGRDPARSQRGWAGAVRTETPRLTLPGCGVQGPSTQRAPPTPGADTRACVGRRKAPRPLNTYVRL